MVCKDGGESNSVQLNASSFKLQQCLFSFRLLSPIVLVSRIHLLVFIVCLMVRIARHAIFSESPADRLGAPLSTFPASLCAVQCVFCSRHRMAAHTATLKEDLSRRATEFLSRMAKKKKKGMFEGSSLGGYIAYRINHLNTPPTAWTNCNFVPDVA